MKMMSTAVTTWLFCAMTAGATAPLAHAADKRLAVPDMRVSGADPSLARVLTEILTTEASATPGVTVIGSSDIAAMLGFEKQKELLGCSDNVACVAEIGGALGVDYLLVSDLGLVGKTYVVNMKLIDTGKVEVKRRLYKTIPGEPDALIEAVKASLPDLLASITGGAAAGPTAPQASSDGAREAQKPPAKTAKAADSKPASTATPSIASAPRRWPAWTVVGLGSAVLVVAAGMEAAATAENSNANKTITVDSAQQFRLHSGDAWSGYESARKQSRQALTFAVVGAVVTGGGLWWLLSLPKAPAVSLVPHVDVNGAGFAVAGIF